MKATKLDGIFNFEVNIYPRNLKGRKIAKGKESEYRLPWQLWKKNLNELVLNSNMGQQ